MFTFGILVSRDESDGYYPTDRPKGSDTTFGNERVRHSNGKTVSEFRYLISVNLFVRLVASADLFWEKNTAGWLLVAGLF
jgi:hypothetical protein